jgi:GT2 family glycosyltransferase
MEKKVCIVIPTHLGGTLLMDCVKSIFNSTNYKNFKVIIVDDFPNDEMVYKIKETFKDVITILMKKHESASYTRNVGIEYSLIKEKADYVVLLDNDIKIVDKNWLKKLVTIIENNEEIGVLAPIIYTPKYYQTYTKKKVHFTKYVPSACIIVRKEVFEKIGGFDPNFWPLGNEDPDFCNRVIAAGFKIAVTGATRVLHQTSNKRRISVYWSFIHTKNYVRYILLNLRKENLHEIFSLIAVRKNFSDSFRPSNLFFTPDWYRRLVFLPPTFLINLTKIKEILKLRRDRSGFYFLSPMIKISDERKHKV